MFNYPNGKSVYYNVAKPVHIISKFTVDATNGAGITGLVGANVNSVLMHTSTTPTGLVNPAVGIIQVNLATNFNNYLGFKASLHGPVTGSALTSVTANTFYKIVTVGTTTAAQWAARGVPAGITPAVNTPFIATTTGALGGNGTVKAQTNSNVLSVELMGASLGGVGNFGQTGSYLYFQCLGSTSSSDTTLIPVAPTAGTIITLDIKMNASAQVVNGL